MKKLFYFTGFLLLVAVFATAQGTSQKTTVLITNANVFDGQNEALAPGMSVLVEDNKITKIAKTIVAPKGATVIDAKGKTLMPGLIDAHWHIYYVFWPMSKVISADFGTLTLAAAKSHRETLMRGFTTVRDAGGPGLTIGKAVDAGLIEGPRVYAAGAPIGQTSGHSDFRSPHNIPAEFDEPLDYLEKTGHAAIADGVPEVMKRTREVLRQGASQIKAMAGGGVASYYDPLDVTEYTFEEAKAICDVAKTWNTYVMIHANTDAAIKQWVEAGAKTIEHGLFIEDETAKLMAEKGVWWSMQPMDATGEDAFKFESPISTAKYGKAVAGVEKVVGLAKKHHVNIAFGTDLQWDPNLTPKQGKFLTKMTKWFTPYETLKMATHDNGQMLKLCGPRDPYPDGELGVIKEGAYADMLIVDGNPLANINLVADPDKNFVLIMKDGKVYKNTIK